MCLGNRHMNAASIAAEVEGVGGQPVSARTMHRTLHQIGLHGCRPRRKPLLKMMYKKARKQFTEDKQTKDIDYWNHVLWSDETKINVFGSDGVKRVWWQPGEDYKDKCVLPTVKHGGGSVMVWGCMSCPVLSSYSSLREPWMPTCTVTYWSRAWSPPFGDWPAGQYSNMIMTAALLKKLRVKVMDWPSMSPDLNPFEHLWGILKWKVEEGKVSNVHQLHDVMEEDSSGNLWSSGELHAQEGLRQLWKIMVATQNIDALSPNWTFLLKSVLTIVASGLDIDGCVLSYFEGTEDLHRYSSCTTLHCSKVSFLQCCHMKRYNKNCTKMWGVY